MRNEAELNKGSDVITHSIQPHAFYNVPDPPAWYCSLFRPTGDKLKSVLKGCFTFFHFKFVLTNLGAGSRKKQPDRWKHCSLAWLTRSTTLSHKMYLSVDYVVMF